MNRLKLEYLFQKYINSASQAEVDEFLLIIQNCSDEEILTLLEKSFNESDAINEKYFSKERGQELLQNILKNEEIPVNEDNSRKIIPIRKRAQWMKYAAIASLLLIGIIVGVLMNNEGKDNTIEIANIDQEIKPGGDKAILELADGTVIDLNSNEKGNIFEKDGLVISKTADGQIVYNAYNSPKSKTFAYNTIRTPKGGQFQVILPDGSKVWLNAASSLKYPEVFHGDERKVELYGEGYFEVANDKDRPFKVVSKGQVVKVLGTHFNINCYDDEPLVKTTLIEGLVQITENISQSSILLKPNEQASLGSSHKFKISKNNVENAVAWKNGFFRFQGAKIDQVMRELSRWYNVEIEVDGKSKELEFWGEIYRNASITDALEILSYFNLKYKVEQINGNKKILIF